MYLLWLARSWFGRGGRRPRQSARYRPEVTALESRWLPSTITEFPLPPLNLVAPFGAVGITAGPDSNVWFADPVAHSVGRLTPAGQVTEFPTPGIDADAITAGPDGSLWFLNGGLTFSGSPAVGRITPAGQVTEFTLPDQLTQPDQITAGPDGNLWLTESLYPTGEEVGRITPAGQVTEFPIPVPPGVNGQAGGITAGPDGNLWFVHDGILARITPAGGLTDHVADAVGGAIAAGPDGNLWTAGARFDPQTGATLGGFIDRIGLDGSVTTFGLDGADMAVSVIRPGPDGNLWFTEQDADQVGRITPAGQVTRFPVPTANSRPLGITGAPNGNVFFTEQAVRQVGEVFLVGTPPAPAAATTTTLALDVAAPAVGQTVLLTATVTSAAGTPAGTVTFFDNNTALGTVPLDASGHAVLTTAFGRAGANDLDALFNGTAAFAPSRSALLQEAVSPAATTITLTASANPIAVGRTLVLTVTVTPAIPGAAAPTGTVILRDGSNTLAFATLDASGRATFTFVVGQTVRTRNGRVTVLGRGTHHLTASFTGDGNFAASVSATFDLTVV